MSEKRSLPPRWARGFLVFGLISTVAALGVYAWAPEYYYRVGTFLFALGIGLVWGWLRR